MRSVTLILFFAFIAIIGLVLMFQASNTGAGTFGIKEGRAMKMVTHERFVKGGSPEGVPVSIYQRKGYLEHMGMEPCPKNYRISPKFTGKPDCVPLKEGMEEYYISSVCCPIGTY